MNVILKTDGREFDAFDDYEPGDAAWFGTEVLLIVSVHNGQAEAIVHPEARAMLQAAMSGPRDDGGSGMAEAMRIHGRAGWQRAMAVCPHPEEEVAPLSGDAWMCGGCGQDVVQSTATDEKIDAAIAEAGEMLNREETEKRLRALGYDDGVCIAELLDHPQAALSLVERSAAPCAAFPILTAYARWLDKQVTR